MSTQKGFYIETDFIFKRFFLSLLVPNFKKTKRYAELYYKMLPNECYSKL